MSSVLLLGKCACDLSAPQALAACARRRCWAQCVELKSAAGPAACEAVVRSADSSMATLSGQRTSAKVRSGLADAARPVRQAADDHGIQLEFRQNLDEKCHHMYHQIKSILTASQPMMG